MIKISNIEIHLDEDKEELLNKTAAKLKIAPEAIEELRIQKESVDARKEPLKFVYTILVRTADEEKVLRKIHDRNVSIYEEQKPMALRRGDRKLEKRPVIVGFGPSGLYAALKLAEEGYRPLVIERGDAIPERDRKVDVFMEKGVLDSSSNIQFGEGGAGAYSDGKLTTRIKDGRVREVVDKLIEAGAPEEIATLAKPHVGTDLLKNVVMNMRKKIIALGGEVLFKSRLEDIRILNGKVVSVTVNKEEIPCEVLILALGHSARDTYEMLFDRGFTMIAKSMAVGVRVENLQWRINESQYGSAHKHPRLKPAEYTLTAKAPDLRGVYSFCMCPGGIVVPAASEEGMLAVNGMSYHARDGVNANSAVVVAVSPEDYGPHPLSGIEFQRELERKAFLMGGSSYHAPVQKVEDFLSGRITTSFDEVIPSYLPGVQAGNLADLFPRFITEGLKKGFTEFDRKIKGFAHHGAVMTGVETRTSSPLRIVRGENLESVNIKGVYPAGEGAGYAGGIISSAVDGLKIAEAVIGKYQPGGL
ncbi:FAD-dependent protein [Proteiniclasticum sp.]|uniref:NAD(P)/FAD-dependent oxidoreductase n=1 Tax=Proteiniclasticum sp. TaxID=2053595 RepID=UPI0028A18D19|nr:hypothetical protein [Proteiniclasticum sp.]